MTEQTVAHTIFSERKYSDEQKAAVGACVNCGNPYKDHEEVRDDRVGVIAFCYKVFFLREKRAKPNEGGGRRKTVAEAKH